MDEGKYSGVYRSYRDKNAHDYKYECTCQTTAHISNRILVQFLSSSELSAESMERSRVWDLTAGRFILCASYAPYRWFLIACCCYGVGLEKTFSFFFLANPNLSCQNRLHPSKKAEEWQDNLRLDLTTWMRTLFGIGMCPIGALMRIYVCSNMRCSISAAVARTFWMTPRALCIV